MTAKDARAVAILNIIFGIAIGLFIVSAAGYGREGQFAVAIAFLTGAIALVWWRVHRAFQITS